MLGLTIDLDAAAGHGRWWPQGATLALDFLAWRGWRSDLGRAAPTSLASFARASAAMRIGPNGLLETAAANAARRDCDAAGGAARGLLMEPARTNLLARSSAFDEAAWSKTGATVAADAAAGPDGAAAADVLTATAASGAATQMLAVTADTARRTLSLYLKPAAAAATAVELEYAGGGLFRAAVDWAGPTVSAAGAATAADVALETAGNGFHRLSVAGANDGRTAATVRVLPAGAGTGAAVAWGAQLEAGEGASSPVATVSAAATRAADAFSVPGGPWFDAAAGTVLVEAAAPLLVNAVLLGLVAGGSFDDALYVVEAAGALTAVMRRGAATVASLSRPWSYGTAMRFAVAWSPTRLRFVTTGQAVASATATPPAFSGEMRLGNTPWSGGVRAALHARRLVHWPTDGLSDAGLQALVGG